MQRLDRPAAGNARRIDVHQEHAHALGSTLRIGLAYHGHHRAEAAVGDPDLVAVDYIGVAVSFRECAKAGDVAAGLRLRETGLSDRFAACVFGEPLALLLFGAAREDEIARAIDAETAPHAGAGQGVAHLFVQDDMVQKIAPAATVLGRHAGLKDSGGPRLAKDVGRENALLLPFAKVGFDLLAEEAPDGLTELVVIVIEYVPSFSA